MGFGDRGGGLKGGAWKVNQKETRRKPLWLKGKGRPNSNLWRFEMQFFWGVERKSKRPPLVDFKNCLSR